MARGEEKKEKTVYKKVKNKREVESLNGWWKLCDHWQGRQGRKIGTRLEP